ncbi:Hypothetical predicted protein [Prunus dulcis]|uniref:Uncharacterized protein n=1 Tax=Prunus dulcis TaxID=3755 RepID=A0A5E4FNN6_PRUDU|nr:Hypothetical predicted protein [Prunus dulcis]
MVLFHTDTDLARYGTSGIGPLADISFSAPTATPLCGPVTNTILQPQGPSIGSSSGYPYGLNVGSNAHQHDGTAVQSNVIAQGQLSASSNFGSVVEELRPFPPLPIRLTYAPAYTSNET